MKIRFRVFCLFYFPIMFGLLEVVYYQLHGHWMAW